MTVRELDELSLPASERWENLTLANDFLNARGKIDDISPDLKAFLDFVLGKLSDDPFVKKLEERLKEAKGNAEWRREP